MGRTYPCRNHISESKRRKVDENIRRELRIKLSYNLRTLCINTRALIAMKILVVTDDRTDRYIIQKKLESEFEIVACASAKEAMEYAEQNLFDIALIDVYIVEPWDGLLLLRDLRKVTNFSFRAIAITGAPSELITPEILEAGFEGVLLHPLNVDEFKKFI